VNDEIRIGVISDTHFPSRGQVLPTICVDRLGRCDLIVHAGDFCDRAALSQVRALGRPLAAVHGNVDDTAVRALLAETAEIALPDGRLLAVVHDAGPKTGRIARLRRRFPTAAIVVFGHSHIPLIERDDAGFLIVNPGSPTDRRRQPHHTMAEVVVRAGQPPEASIIVLDPERG
jgi:uncharacterized protein